MIRDTSHKLWCGMTSVLFSAVSTPPPLLIPSFPCPVYFLVYFFVCLCIYIQYTCVDTVTCKKCRRVVLCVCILKLYSWHYAINQFPSLCHPIFWNLPMLLHVNSVHDWVVLTTFYLHIPWWSSTPSNCAARDMSWVGFLTLKSALAQNHMQGCPVLTNRNNWKAV